MNRRQFFKATAGTAAVLASSRRAYAFQQSPTNLRKFIIGLPGLGPTAKNEIGQYIPVATPNTTVFKGCDYYTLVAAQYTEQLHPDLPKATKLWGYADYTPLWGRFAGSQLPSSLGQASAALNSPLVPFEYLGPVIVATRGRPVRMTMTNLLPPIHPLPVDASAFFPDAQTFQNKIAVHLHGGFVPWISDGGPFAWYTQPSGPVGPDYPLQVPDMPRLAGSFNYYYPNDQSARLMWYHDHAHDLTRINAYAGLASAYLLADAAEGELVNAGIIPSTQIPLVIQDKSFKSKADQWGMPGDLWYPSVYEGPPNQNLPSMLYDDVASCTAGSQTDPCGTGRWDHVTPSTQLPIPSAVPEAFFDTILVNGAVFPYLSLPAKRYRFRILNGSQARFFNLQLYVKDNNSADGINLQRTGELDGNGNPLKAPMNPPGPAFIQIGSEGGFLPAPVVFSRGGGNVNSNRVIGWDLVPNSPTNGNVNRYNLLLAPAERADVIIDFRGFENSTLVLYNDAPAPFPGGDIRNDYFVGAPDLTGIGGAPPPQPGKSPNTRTLMVIRVGPRAPDSKSFSETVTSLQVLQRVFADTQPAPLNPSGVPVRQLALYEVADQFGRLTQMIGTLTGPKALLDAPTEITHAGDTEVWQIFNTTADTHPIHFHLVNVQIVSRAPTDGGFNIVGPELPPDPNEAGWKETVRMNPNEAIKMIMKFDLPAAPFTVPQSTRTGVRGHEYMYHCHILEHEEHDMMRPLMVVP